MLIIPEAPFMKLTLVLVFLTLCFSPATFAQDVQDSRTRRLLEEAAKNGRELTSEITVKNSVHVQAVLIPRIDAKRIFGKEISENYAVIQVTVGNKSPIAALIIHGVFIDYRHWTLSGVPPSDMVAERSTNKHQAPSVPSQVASEEYRVVRGQLLDAQSDTTRNRFLRWLTLAGNLAGAFTFSLNEQGIVKGIAAITGVGIPGVATAWPDRTVDQLNRVSDLGFRTNKLVPKESAEIIVCFFPIDRFLTSGFRELFLKSPALFFAPLQQLFDKKAENEVKSAVGDLLEESGLTYLDLRNGLHCYMEVRHGQPSRIGYDVCLDQMGLETYKDPDTKEKMLRAIATRDANGKIVRNAQGKPLVDPGFIRFMALEFIGNVSLNRVTVTVDGVMAVNVDSISPRVDEVVINLVADCGNAGNECLWTNVTAGGGVRRGVIRGAYLKGAEIKLAEAEALSITDLKKIEEGSTDNELHFSFKLNAPIPNQTKLHFTLTKPAAGANGKPFESNTWEYVVAYFPSATAISSVIVDKVSAPAKLTVKGRGFKATPLIVSLIPTTGDPITIEPTAVTEVTPESFEATLPTEATKRPGCWQVQVKAGGLTSNQSEMFAVPPDPALDSAERTDKFIFVKGKDLIDFGACGGQQVSFKALKTGATVPIDLKVKDWNNGAPLLELPDALKEGEWKIQVFLKGVTEKKGEKPLTVRQ
jgi:hypothetical protein